MFYDVCRQNEVIHFVPAPGLPVGDLRILTITLKHTVLVQADNEANADFLILPNTGACSCSYEFTYLTMFCHSYAIASVCEKYVDCG